MSTGYSGTPLGKKLGLKERYNILLHNAPEHYFDLFSDLPPNLNILNIDQSEEKEIDFIHLFFTSLHDLQIHVGKFIRTLKKDGLLWISWPKGQSKIQTDLKRDLIRAHILDLGLVDIKVAAIDEDWSGLKFVYRTKDRRI
ncbi:DUF3052 domain-containing protein [Muricauda sp. 334s03]|uniref:DUF3052 domain-containing protein n=1 Tax=Flagellimonas yonaguniensis TaxID=3031325 RepID=A0ABT5Y359_9FLAO|nr:DUF3052 domain-containing protein [[Muricauda] yonaguniensis]MDF0717887.1 DUF3052 domain-containing protein [[Muricauda] yonaguniensis]